MKDYIKILLVNIIYLIVPNKIFIILRYYYCFKKKLNLSNPKTFTEKIQYFKLNRIQKIYSDLADKYIVRDYIKSILGEKILTKLYWVGENPRDIPFSKLPNSFVIKCNHGSGYNIIVKNKSTIDINKTIKKLNLWMKDDFYKKWREMQYKNISKKIIIEEYLDDKNRDVPLDYKFFCFNGNPEMIQLNIDRYGEHKVNFYDINWTLLDFKTKNGNSAEVIEKPNNLEDMIKYAKILSNGFNFVRIDFYSVRGKIYFGEITFTPWSGYEQFFPDHDKLDLMLGDKILL